MAGMLACGADTDGHICMANGPSALYGSGRIKIMRLLRLFGAIFSLSLRRELAFRANLVFQLLMTVIGIVAGLATLQIIYTQTSKLSGWSLGEAIVLLGTFQIMSGLLATFIEPNIVWFASQVKDACQ